MSSQPATRLRPLPQVLRLWVLQPPPQEYGLRELPLHGRQPQLQHAEEQFAPPQVVSGQRLLHVSGPVLSVAGFAVSTAVRHACTSRWFHPAAPLRPPRSEHSGPNIPSKAWVGLTVAEVLAPGL